MASTKRAMNWTPVTYASSTLTGVTNVGFDYGGSTVPFSGDGDRFPTTIVCDFMAPTATVSLADTAAAFAIPPGTRSSLVATLLDAKNLATASGGGRTFTLANAICATSSLAGAHRQIAMGQLMFQAESTDGTTNPLTSSAL